MVPSCKRVPSLVLTARADTHTPTREELRHDLVVVWTLCGQKRKKNHDTPCEHRWRQVTVLHSNGGAPVGLYLRKSTKVGVGRVESSRSG